MKILITGSTGHLGEALVRTLSPQGHDIVAVDIQPSSFTTHTGNIADPFFVQECMKGVDIVLHTATLHKPHVGTHSRQEFIDTNITGTLQLLEAATANKVKAFIFTSTTSVFGDALIPPPGQPAAWITEEVTPQPKNIYGVTKTAAEDLCQLFYRNQKLPVLILRTSRFFPEQDDNKGMRDAFDDDNLKALEYLYRRVDVEDVVTAHIVAMHRAQEIGFGKYIISATTPFTTADLPVLRAHAPQVIKQIYPAAADIFAQHNWKFLPHIDRVYVNEKARRELHWQPQHDFGSLLQKLQQGQSIKSKLADIIGAKGYHATSFSEGPYPVNH
ncbi:NAD(P)-dependent oxidoreductase [Chitinophaga sp.]|uniref:NAD-dependent epimerase/dehydratase family protein n=1 Tax=Chitinophaga sp. TaxID=1869181 RepID=UPI0031D87C0B